VYDLISLFEEFFSPFSMLLRSCFSLQIKGVEVDEGLDTFNSYFSEDLPPLAKVLLLIPKCCAYDIYHVLAVSENCFT
jgi:hypothetical protein